jgi:hypothetical protein
MADSAIKAFTDENGEAPEFSLNLEQFQTDIATVKSGIEELKTATADGSKKMSGEWVASLNRLALTTGMSVDEMNSLLGSMGV